MQIMYMGISIGMQHECITNVRMTMRRSTDIQVAFSENYSLWKSFLFC